jgi:HlyD family secretion protein
MTTRRTFWLVGVLLVTAGGLAGLSFVLLQRSAPPPPQPTAAAPAADAGIGCLGRIEPEDGLVRVAARSISGQPSIVGELKVREGETVSPGQLLALLDSRAQLAAALRSAESRVALARTRLAQVKAGPKAADVAAQNAEIARLASELATAEKELHRYEALVERGISPSAGLDARRQRVASNRQALAHARARLESLSEVRREDVDVGEAELEAAQTEVVRARTDLAETSIHAPVAGQVVRVYAWPGEEVGPRGLLEIGKTARMYAIAEVPESDIPRLRVG